MHMSLRRVEPVVCPICGNSITAYPERIAAIILEPISHDVGCVLPKPGSLLGLRRLYDREGIVLIFEVTLVELFKG
jgi:glutamate-1-semialdehyde aminotransferase